MKLKNNPLGLVVLGGRGVDQGIVVTISEYVQKKRGGGGGI